MYPADHDGRPLDGESAPATLTFADRIAERLANLPFRGGSSDVTPTEAAGSSDAPASEAVTPEATTTDATAA